ncbi:MAG: type II toxin-antitoxin system VapC family toxin [Acidimicrobiia bacterium]
MEIWYLDTSALTKFVRPEPETGPLRQWLASRRWIVSDLHRTELRRASARAGGRALARAEWLLMESDIIRVDAEVFDRAGRLLPFEIRSLDALHLAAAMTLGTDLAGIVTYDRRLSATSELVGIDTASPGSS